MRSVRKKEHIENYLKTCFQGDTLFGDVFIEHNALPNLNFDEIDTKIEFLGKTIDFPIMLNAMTGGSELTGEINRDLAQIAKDYNIPMAVGSQTIISEEDEEIIQSFRIAREVIGDNGILISNLSGQATIEEAKKAIEIINADAIQIHLNVAQELVMKEGDRDFKGIINNIKSIVDGVNVPVIVKEVGFGISPEVAVKLMNVGVKYVDISGFGGTNFIEIENLRNIGMDFSELYSWGIPTAASLIKCKNASKDLKLISSGGIKNSMDIVKSLILGAELTAISGEILAYLVHGGYENAKEYMESLTYKTKIIMTLLGKKDISDLKTTQYKLTGKLKDII